MIGFTHNNTILNRLPMSLCGITHVNFAITGGVCLKLNRYKRVTDAGRHVEQAAQHF